MENVSIKSMVIKYGLTIGLIFSLIAVLSMVTGMATTGNAFVGILMGLLQLGLMIAIIIIAFNKFKVQRAGYISLGECMQIGVGIMVIGGLIAAVFGLVYGKLIDPGYYDRIMEVQRQTMEDRGMSDDQIDKAMGFASIFKGPGIAFATTLLCYFLGGTILSLIIGLVMRNEKPEFE